jgi:hypothetical protein
MSDDPNRESRESSPPLTPESAGADAAGEVELYWNRPREALGTGDPTGAGLVGTTRLDANRQPPTGSGWPHVNPDAALDPANLAGLWIDLGSGD